MSRARGGSGSAEPKVTHERGPYTKSSVRREQILAAATVVFGEVGYASASIREVAQRIGVSHATITFHFPTKAELLAAVLKRQESNFAAMLDAAPAAPMQFLAGVCRLFEHRRSDPRDSEVFLMLAAEAWEPGHPAHAHMVWRYGRLRDTLVAVFTALAEQGLMRTGADPEEAARVGVALTDGLQLQWFYAPREVDVGADLARYFFGLLNVRGGRELEALLRAH